MFDSKINKLKREIDYLSKVYSPKLKKVKILKDKLKELEK